MIPRAANFLQGAFIYLGQQGLSGEQTFRDILAVLFNAQVSGALHV